MYRSRSLATGMFALTLFALSSSPVAAQDKSPIGARVKTPLGPVALPQATARAEMKSSVEGFAITIKRDGKIIGTLALPRDKESRVYLISDRSRLVKDGSTTTSVFSGSVMFRLEQNGKQVLEFSADEITLQVITSTR